MAHLPKIDDFISVQRHFRLENAKNSSANNETSHVALNLADKPLDCTEGDSLSPTPSKALDENCTSL